MHRPPVHGRVSRQPERRRGRLDGYRAHRQHSEPRHPQTGHPSRGIVLHPLVSEALVFACRPDHPLAGRPDVSVADLAGETILRFPPGWGIRETVNRVFGDAPGATEIADYALMAKLIQGGFGTTLIPASAIAAAPGLRSVPLADPRLQWNLSAAISASRRPTAATNALLRALTQASSQAASRRRRPGSPG